MVLTSFLLKITIIQKEAYKLKLIYIISLKSSDTTATKNKYLQDTFFIIQ